MKKNLLIICILLLCQTLHAQDVEKLRQSLNLLTETRNGNTFSLSAMGQALAQSDSLVAQIGDIQQVIEEYPVLAYRQNTEYAYLKYLFFAFQQQEDSARRYLRLAYLSADRSEEKLNELNENKRNSSDNSIALASQKLQLARIQEELKHELPLYGMASLAAEGSDFASAEVMPRLTPWPPPKPSDRYEMTDRMLRRGLPRQATLGDVDGRLSAALQQTGYGAWEYFAVPNGFALVTRLERFGADGSPEGNPPRWDLGKNVLREFSMWSYIKALFTANPAFYRVFVFVVTDKPFAVNASAEIGSFEKAFEGGVNRLPRQLARQRLSDAHYCSVLVYEFERPYSHADDASVRLLQPGKVTCADHLNSTGLLGHLR